jgi:hypothetical protein
LSRKKVKNVGLPIKNSKKGFSFSRAHKPEQQGHHQQDQNRADEHATHDYNGQGFLDLASGPLGQ